MKLSTIVEMIKMMRNCRVKQTQSLIEVKKSKEQTPFLVFNICNNELDALIIMSITELHQIKINPSRTLKEIKELNRTMISQSTFN